MMRYMVYLACAESLRRASVSGSGDSCWQISVNVSKTVQDRDILTKED